MLGSPNAPQVQEINGNQVWVWDDLVKPNIGLNAVVGRPKNEWGMEPQRFDHMRKAAYDLLAGEIADAPLGNRSNAFLVVIGGLQPPLLGPFLVGLLADLLREPFAHCGAYGQQR